MEQTLAALAKHLEGRLIGDGSVLIRGVNNLDAVKEGELTFAESPQRLAQAMGTHASALIVPAQVKELGGRPGISVENPKLAFALVLELFHPSALPHEGVHPTVVLGDRIQLGPNVDIRAHAVIGNDVCLGQGTVIEAGAHVGDGVTVGQHCLIGPHVVLYRQTVIGDRVRLHAGTVIGGDGFGYVFHEGRHVKVPQVGNVIIEDDVELGCNVCVDRATIGSTIIRRGTKIDNLVQIGHNGRIGQHVIMTGQVGLSGSVTIGNYAMLGGKAGVVDHVTIGDRAQVGAASVVTKSVAPGEVVWGYPARPIRSTKHQMAALAQLPAMLKRLGGMLTRMGKIEDRMQQVEQSRQAGRSPAPRSPGP